MRWSDVLELIGITYTINSMGNSVPTKEKKPVYCNRKSIRQSEYYQAMAQNLKLEEMFEIRAFDYDNETELEYGGQEFDIVRTYTKNGEIMELVCKIKAGE